MLPKLSRSSVSSTGGSSPDIFALVDIRGELDASHSADAIGCLVILIAMEL